MESRSGIAILDEPLLFLEADFLPWLVLRLLTFAPDAISAPILNLSYGSGFALRLAAASLSRLSIYSYKSWIRDSSSEIFVMLRSLVILLSSF